MYSGCSSGRQSPLLSVFLLVWHWTPARVRKLAHLMTSRTREEFHWRSISAWPDPPAIIRGTSASGTLVNEALRGADESVFVEWLMAIDTLSYLPNNILVKVDRAAMGVSLETRAPFLDHRVMEFVWRLPLWFRIRGAESKRILRQVLYRYVPKRLVDRPKAGFGVPLGRSPLGCVVSSGTGRKPCSANGGCGRKGSSSPARSAGRGMHS